MNVYLNGKRMQYMICYSNAFYICSEFQTTDTKYGLYIFFFWSGEELSFFWYIFEVYMYALYFIRFSLVGIGYPKIVYLSLAT